MATTRKGWRRLVVDGRRYRWMVRREAGYWNNIFNKSMRFIVESSEGALLVVELNRPRLDYWAYPELKEAMLPVKPHEVAQEIRAALCAGWNAKVKEKPFFYNSTR